ncbi:methyltransferase domain-containing protein [Oscillatoria amoena NRMC-F 0135]|nr:methyltransferase domain-containing protein [Oscillatoria amoena NRMC-F 0135]
MSKIHRNLCEPVIAALDEIFNRGRYADRVLERILKEDKRRGARDRAFIAENTYEIVRWRRLLAHCVGKESLTQFAPLDLWKLLGARLVLNGHEIPKWAEFAALDAAEVRKRRKSPKPRAVEQSIPDWLDQRGERELREAWPQELAALNRPAALVVRCNLLKTSPEAVARCLREMDVPSRFDPRYPHALILEKRVNLFTTDLFKNGLIEVQDAASQEVSAFLDAAPGMRIIDACAGAGGKSLHLSALTGNKGRIMALDTVEKRLDETRKRAARAGADNIEARLIESSKTIKRMEKSADRLLLDVPCSGLGVLRRNPDAKWKLSPEEIERVQAVQRDILTKYPAMLKPGGVMVYATCSILPTEGEEQIAWFLQENSGYKLLAQKRLTVAGDGFDGFYMARLQRV